MAGMCRDVFPDGRLWIRNGMHVWTTPEPNDQTVKWFRVGNVHHLGIDHARSTTDTMARLMLTVVNDFVRRNPSGPLCFALERPVLSESLVVDYYLGRMETGMPWGDAGMINAFAVAANRERPVDDNELHVIPAEEDPRTRFLTLSSELGEERALQFFIEREREWATYHFGPHKKEVFDAVFRMLTDDIFIDAVRLGSLMDSERARPLPDLAAMKYTLTRLPENAGPFRDVAEKEWHIRNESAASRYADYGRKMPTLGVAGWLHSDAYLQGVRTLMPEFDVWTL